MKKIELAPLNLSTLQESDIEENTQPTAPIVNNLFYATFPIGENSQNHNLTYSTTSIVTIAQSSFFEIFEPRNTNTSNLQEYHNNLNLTIENEPALLTSYTSVVNVHLMLLNSNYHPEQPLPTLNSLLSLDAEIPVSYDYNNLDQQNSYPDYIDIHQIESNTSILPVEMQTSILNNNYQIQQNSYAEINRQESNISPFVSSFPVAIQTSLSSDNINLHDSNASSISMLLFFLETGNQFNLNQNHSFESSITSSILRFLPFDNIETSF